MTKQNETAHQVGDRLTFEITDEMIEAGSDAALYLVDYEWVAIPLDRQAIILKTIFAAMVAKRPS